MKGDLSKRLDALERRQGASEDNRYRVTLVFDGDPEPARIPGTKVIRLDFTG